MKKRKIILSFLIMMFLNVNMFSQMLVEDLTAIATAISNGFHMYNELQTSIQQYENMVNQLQATVKDMASFDVSNYDWTKWDASLHMIDHYMDQIDNIDYLINNNSMQIGGKKFSLKDVYTTTLYSDLLSEAERNLDYKNITTEQERKFVSAHGLKKRHWDQLVALETELRNKAAETKALNDTNRENVLKNMEALQQIENNKATGSANAIAEQQNDILIQQAKAELEMCYNLNVVTSLLSDSITQDLVHKEAEREQREAINRDMEQEVNHTIESTCGNEEDYLQMN